MIFKRLLYIIFSIVTLSGCNIKSSEDYHKEANQLEKEHKYKDAIILLDKAIEKSPSNIKALLDRAVDKSIIEDYNGAIEDYSKVIELDANNGLAFLNRGKNKNRLKNYKGAISDFDKAITTKGGEHFYINKVESSFIETGFEFDVDMEEIRYERGIARYNIDSLKLAFEDFNFCIQKNFELTSSYYWRGIIYLLYNKNDNGCEDLIKSMELGFSDAKDLVEKNCR